MKQDNDKSEKSDGAGGWGDPILPPSVEADAVEVKPEHDAVEETTEERNIEPESYREWTERKHGNGAADIVFLIDVTGSMSPCIDALKKSIKQFFFELTNGTDSIKPVEDWRARIIGFRDYPADHDKSYGWLNQCNFTRDTEVLEKELDSLKTVGGGDEPESLLDAVSFVLDAGELPADNQLDVDDRRWRSRAQVAHILVVFTDAPYHETMSVPEHEGETYDDLFPRLTDFRTHGFLFVPDSEQYEHSFGETSNMIIHNCGAGADGLESVMSNPDKLEDILLRLQRGISRSSQAY